MITSTEERLNNEIAHGKTATAIDQAEMGWISPAGSIRRQRRSQFLSHGLPRTTRVLEVGAGTGLQTLDLCAAFDHIEAIDISPELLAVASQRAPRANYNVMDAHCPTFKECSFDMIAGVSILHHLDWDVSLNNYFRLLKPGGIVRFSEPNLFNPLVFLIKNCAPVKRWAGDSPDETAFTKWRITRSLKNAGYTNTNVRPFEFLHCSTPEVLIPLTLICEKLISGTPLNEFGASLLIEAQKP